MNTCSRLVTQSFVIVIIVYLSFLLCIFIVFLILGYIVPIIAKYYPFMAFAYTFAAHYYKAEMYRSLCGDSCSSSCQGVVLYHAFGGATQPYHAVFEASCCSFTFIFVY